MEPAYEKQGAAGLINSKPCPQNPKLRPPAPIAEKILHLRRTDHLGPLRIAWYLKRSYDITISTGGLRNVLLRHGLNRLPKNASHRAPLIHGYEKQVPGHHLQVDVKFLDFQDVEGQTVRRFQYTAIDDANRVRALKVYERHSQANAMDFLDQVGERFLFRIHTVRTDNGHEFRTKFHGHVEDFAIMHRYVKPRTPRGGRRNWF
jgi:hypothetical protein